MAATPAAQGQGLNSGGGAGGRHVGPARGVKAKVSAPKRWPKSFADWAGVRLNLRPMAVPNHFVSAARSDRLFTRAGRRMPGVIRAEAVVQRRQFSHDVYVEGGILDVLQWLEVAQGADGGVVVECLLQKTAEAGQTVRVVAQSELAERENGAMVFQCLPSALVAKI